MSNKTQTLDPPGDWQGIPKVADFTQDSLLLSVGGWGGKACVFSAKDGALLKSFGGDRHDELNFASLTGDQKTLVTRDVTGVVTIWDVASGKQLQQFGGDKKPDAPDATISNTASGVGTGTAAFTGLDGVAVGSADDAGAPDEKERPWYQFPIHSTGWMAVTRHRKGPQYLAVTEQVRTFFYSLEDGRLLETYSGFNPLFDPNGRFLFLGNGNNLEVYNLGTANLARAPRAFGFGDATFSADGKRLAVSALDPKSGVPVVTIIDVPNFTKITSLTGHTATVTAACFSADGKRLVTVAEDATARLWDLTLGFSAKPEDHLIATFIGVGANDYVVATREGYYTASKGALKKVGFRFGEDVFAFDQFDLELNRPDIVLTRLGRASKPLLDKLQEGHRMRLNRMGLPVPVDNADMLFHNNNLRAGLPEIDVPNDLPLLTADRDLTFAVNVKDTAVDLNSVLVYVNEVPLNGTRGESIVSKHTRQAAVPVSVRLLPGLNKIQVSVTNILGRESMRWTGWVNCSAPAPAPCLFVLAVGISHYQSPEIGQLAVADKDAEDISTYFSSLTAGFPRVAAKKSPPPRVAWTHSNLDGSGETAPARYEQVFVRTLCNEQATCQNIRREAAQFLAGAREEDHIILYFAGHGKIDLKDFVYYFLANDTDPQKLQESAFSYAQLENLMDGVKARQRLVFLDTCHSGEVLLDPKRIPKGAIKVASRPPTETKSDPFLGAARGLPGEALTEDDAGLLVRELFTDLRRGTGAEVIAAASGSQSAYEEGQNGAFTGSLLDLLREKRGTSIPVSTLSNGVFSRVEKGTEGRQKPVVRAERVEFDFDLLLGGQ